MLQNVYVCGTMKHNATQRGQTIRNDSGSASAAQQLIDLKIRVLEARKGFLNLGTEDYMSFIAAQATREGVVLDTNERKAIRQVINGRVFSGDVARVELIERALLAQAA